MNKVILKHVTSALDLNQSDEETLRLLIDLGTPENSRRAFLSDLNYIGTWHRLVTGEELSWPASPAIYLKFIAHHLFRLDERLRNPDHGMPMVIDREMCDIGIKKKTGPHAPSTVKRRLNNWNTAHTIRNLVSPTKDNPAIMKTFRKARTASGYRKAKKSPKALTVDNMRSVFELCGQDEPADIRDAAIMAVMFFSGGRRRSEISEMLREDVSRVAGFIDADGNEELAYSIGLRKTKTTGLDDDVLVFVRGEVATYLQRWLKFSPFTDGPLFYRIYRGGHLPNDPQPLKGDRINEMIKKRCAAVGITDVSAHGVRAGFMTEADRAKITLSDAMAMSLHKDARTAMGYSSSHGIADNPASKLLG